MFPAWWSFWSVSNLWICVIIGVLSKGWQVHSVLEIKSQCLCYLFPGLMQLMNNWKSHGILNEIPWLNSHRFFEILFIYLIFCWKLRELWNFEVNLSGTVSLESGVGCEIISGNILPINSVWPHTQHILVAEEKMLVMESHRVFT